MVDHRDTGLQPPIHFGGVQLPELPPTEQGWSERLDQYETDASRLAGLVFMDAVLYGEPRIGASREHVRLAVAAPPPAGTATPGRRLLDVARLALSARILHGAKLSDLEQTFKLLSEIEEGFLTE